MKYHMKQPDNMPYADSVTVSLSDPHTLRIYVNEKEKIGYVYLPEQKQYGYLDKNGLVLRMVKKPLEDTIHLVGIKFSGGELYQKVQLEDKTILSELLRAVRLLEKYGIPPETIYVQSSNAIYLVYGRIYVNIGSTNLLNEKLVRVNSILPKLKKEKLKGVLHLETWTESTTDIYFRKKESIKIPKDEDSASAKSSEKETADAKSSDKDSASSKSTDKDSASSKSTDEDSTSSKSPDQ
jgi:cell division protein FtsQ